MSQGMTWEWKFFVNDIHEYGSCFGDDSQRAICDGMGRNPETVGASDSVKVVPVRQVDRKDVPEIPDE